MKLYTLFALSMVIIVGLCQALTCEEANELLGIEYEGNCCELQQINCDENNETILSIESLEDYDYDDTDNTLALYRRKGGGGHGGGHSSGHSSSHSSSGKSSSSGKTGYYGGYYHGSHSKSGAFSAYRPSYIWMVAASIFALFVFNH